MRELRTLFPNADVTLQRHRLGWARDQHAPTLTVWGVLVRRKIGPFNVRREYLAPAPEDSMREPAVVQGASMAVFDKQNR